MAGAHFAHVQVWVFVCASGCTEALTDQLTVWLLMRLHVHTMYIFNKPMTDDCLMHVDVTSSPHNVGLLRYSVAACIVVCVFICLCGHCYRFLPISFLFYLLYIKLTISASFPSVPNNHPHPCVCACMQDSVPKCGCFLFFHTRRLIFTDTHSRAHTHTCVWSAASVVFAVVATECPCLVRCDWCVRTDKNMPFANSFWNTFRFYFCLLDTQDQVDTLAKWISPNTVSVLQIERNSPHIFKMHLETIVGFGQGCGATLSTVNVDEHGIVPYRLWVLSI